MSFFMRPLTQITQWVNYKWYNPFKHAKIWLMEGRDGFLNRPWLNIDDGRLIKKQAASRNYWSVSYNFFEHIRLSWSVKGVRKAGQNSCMVTLHIAQFVNEYFQDVGMSRMYWYTWSPNLKSIHTLACETNLEDVKNRNHAPATLRKIEHALVE